MTEYKPLDKTNRCSSARCEFDPARNYHEHLGFVRYWCDYHRKEHETMYRSDLVVCDGVWRVVEFEGVEVDYD